MNTKSRSAKAAEKKIDAEIDRVYRENCSGIQVSILDIPSIFAEGRKAMAEGRDLKMAIVNFVETIRHN